MTHRYHPDPELDDPTDAILYDHCEDCAARATLQGLDERNTRRAFNLMLQVERSAERGAGRTFYLTCNERELCTRLHAAYMAFDRIGVFASTVSYAHTDGADIPNVESPEGSNVPNGDFQIYLRDEEESVREREQAERDMMEQHRDANREGV